MNPAGDDAKPMSPTPQSPAPQSPVAQSPTPMSPNRSSVRRAARREHSGKKETMNGPLYMQSSNNVVIVRRIKRKGEGPMKQLSRWFVENQIGLSFNLLTLLLLVHACMPKARCYTTKFYTLAYFRPTTGNYGLGSDDAYLVTFCTVLFTGLRAAAIEYMLAPFAKYRGISKRKDITRFSEQAWLLIYYSVFWTLGAYIYYKSPYFMNLENLWTDWPTREISGIMKGYILAQLAFWIQQVIVINIEERRKDHVQMFTHHIVTISLIYASYRYHHTRVGNLILVLMDVVDIFLPFAKCLKYLGYTTLCDYAFGLFMVSWVAARHVLYLTVCYSVYAHLPIKITPGCYNGSKGNFTGPIETPMNRGPIYMLEPLWETDGIVCFDKTVRWCFLSMLLFLQGLTLVWFTMIVRVAVNVLKGAGADDSRSDDEGDGLEDDDEEEFVYEEAQPLEEEVGVGELNLTNWERRSGVKRQNPTATGVSLPGHSDRKELLGRIGCEKQVD